MNAHYTPPEITRAIWDAAQRMGYSGGPTLEPAVGTGIFFGTRPQHLDVKMHGIEMDSLSCRLAQQLHQTADIRHTSYQDFRMPEGKFNLAISNVPFSDYKPYEPKATKTPGIDKPYSLHDFYFLKTLHGVREGGLVAFVTSRYTMDKENTEVREKIAQNADFVGAIRLPSNAFKQIANTDVVTDIVFLQKRSPEKEMSDLTRSFIDTAQLTLPNSTDDGHSQVPVNQYYLDHPENVLGSENLHGTMHGPNQYTVLEDAGTDAKELTTRLLEAIRRLPENIANFTVDNATAQLEQTKIDALSHIDPETIPVGSYVMGNDERIYMKDSASLELAEAPFYADVRFTDKEIARLRGMVEIKSSMKNYVACVANGQAIDAAEHLRQLNSSYEAFVKTNGPLHKAGNARLFAGDPETPMLMSLENWDSENKTATKADLFKGISLARPVAVTSVDSSVEALSLSLAQYGVVNPTYMASLTGQDESVLIEDLLGQQVLFEDPRAFLAGGSEPHYLTNDSYISGNVRFKLEQAKEAADKEPARFSRNVSALEQAIPKDIPPGDIALQLNSPILRDEHVRDFVNQLLDTDHIDVVHIRALGKWDVQGRAWGAKQLDTYGTHRMGATEIIDAMLNGKPVQVYDRHSDGTRTLNQEETTKAELKSQDIGTKFQEWVWSDHDRTEDLHRRYNDLFNNTVNRSYTHPARVVDPNAEVRFPGCAFPHPARPHQADAVWRNIQTNNGMLAHVVGAGKTLEMVWTAMEKRRLGLARKPMIVFPNHMVEQWSNEFMQAYPGAKLLVATDKDFSKDNRREFINKVATGDWDCVLIKMSHFEMIPLSTERQKQFFEEKVDEYSGILADLDDANQHSRHIKELRKSLEKYKDKVKELMDTDKDTGVIPFDQLGVDQLFVDEADLFKNLEYYTQLQNVRGLGPATGSNRAFDMMMKVREVQRQGGGVVFATGTPISNTLVEAYTMMRFLQPEKLKALGIEAFDEWGRMFGQAVTQMELNNTGTGYKPVSRFSKIVNVPELMTALGEVWDVQTSETLERAGILVPGKQLPHSNITNLSAPATPVLKSYLKHLECREKNLSGKAEEGKNNVLVIIKDGQKAAIDMRLIHPNLPDDPNSKLNLAVNKAVELHNKHADDRSVTCIFYDLTAPDKRRPFDVHHDMRRKMIEAGIPANEIAFVHHYDTDAKKKQFFDAVNEGQFRVIFGSTPRMGAGTNVQKRLKSVIHMDTPWRPRDIEQRNGRAIRQGNTSGTVDIYNLVTKGSLDTGMWNVLETKNTSIKQIMSGFDRTTREISEDYFGSVKELSIDNPLMKEAVELQHSLKKLDAMHRAHTSQTAYAKRSLQSYPGKIADQSAKLAKIEEDLARRAPEPKGKDFTITVQGKEFTERKEAGKELLRIAERTKLDLAQSNNFVKESEPIGNYAGFPLKIVAARTTDGDYTAKIVACGNFNYSSQISAKEPDPVGTLRSLHYALYTHAPSFRDDCASALSRLQSDLKEFAVLADKPFTHEDEIRTKQVRSKEVFDLLAQESQKQEEHPDTVPWSALSSREPGGIQQVVTAIETLNASSQISQPDSQPTQIAQTQGLSHTDVTDAITLRAFATQEGVDLPIHTLQRMEAALAKGTHPRELAQFVRGLAYRKALEQTHAAPTSISSNAGLSLKDVKDIDTLKQYAQQLGVNLPTVAFDKMEVDLDQGQTPYQLACFVRGVAFQNNPPSQFNVKEQSPKNDQDKGIEL